MTAPIVLLTLVPVLAGGALAKAQSGLQGVVGVVGGGWEDDYDNNEDYDCDYDNPDDCHCDYDIDYAAADEGDDDDDDHHHHHKQRV